MCDDLADLVLRVTLLLFVAGCIKFWPRWTTANAAAVNGAGSSRSSGDPALVQGQEDRPQEMRADVVRWPLQGTGGCSRSGEFKVSVGGCSIAIEGAQREPFAKLFFKLNCIMIGKHTRVQLTLDQVDFGVKNCCKHNCFAKNQQCGKNCKTVFIHRMEIQVRPKSWAHECHRMQMQPYHIAEVFGLQRSSTFNFQIPFVCPRQASVAYQTGNTFSRTAAAFQWIPARRDDATKSVSWTWELYRYANGRKLEFDTLRWGPRPLLAFMPGDMHFHPGSFLAEASWEFQSNVELFQQRLEWDVKVSLHTATMLNGKRRLPGYSITAGPTLTFEKLLVFS